MGTKVRRNPPVCGRVERSEERFFRGPGANNDANAPSQREGDFNSRDLGNIQPGTDPDQPGCQVGESPKQPAIGTKVRRNPPVCGRVERSETSELWTSGFSG
ncbi:hypothetical protein CKO51_14050, partial [Rhodopirellula sp. SM50]